MAGWRPSPSPGGAERLGSGAPPDCSATWSDTGGATLALPLRAVSFEADRAAQVSWGKVVMEGVPVVMARHLPSMLRQLPAVLGPERVAAVASQARIRFRAVACTGPNGC